MDIDYTNEKHLAAFRAALSEPNSDSKITSRNDWGPVHTKLAATKRNDYFQSRSYRILRFPMLILILLWCSFLVVLYLFVRAYIALYEYLFTWTGRRQAIRKDLRRSKTYSDWVINAKKLDEFLHLNAWRSQSNFYYYDYTTLKITVNKLKHLQAASSYEELLHFLPTCIKANFAGTENPILYSRTYYGTKEIVEEYNSEVVKSLEMIINDKSLSPILKLQFFKVLNKNFGKTALCLSGGACFAYNHFGVIKALVENDLLPNIISGTSGGGLVAALATTRTNEELKQLIVPELADKITACSSDSFSVWFKRLLQTGARFDSVDWASKSMWFTMGSMTFKEAYERTGKILNISTVPSDPHSPVILCNHITSPDCVIWSTLLASSAVPGILNPVVLMMKDPKTNEIKPYSYSVRYKDGSLRTDIPVEALNTYYNVKFSIVSQVNPHISLFFFAPKGSVGRPVSRKSVGLRGGFIAAGLENFIKLENNKWLKFIKSLDLMPHFMDQDWSNVWLQKFSGTITIWPKTKLKDFWYILSDPSRERLAGMIRSGELSTYPKLLFIKHRLNIERTIEKGLKKYKKEVRNMNKQLKSKEISNAKETLMSSDSDDDVGHKNKPRDYSLDTAIDELSYQVKFDVEGSDEDEDSDENEDSENNKGSDDTNDDSDKVQQLRKNVKQLLPTRRRSWW